LEICLKRWWQFEEFDLHSGISTHCIEYGVHLFSDLLVLGATPNGGTYDEEEHSEQRRNRIKLCKKKHET
jgi:hypothetical protein